MPEKSKYPWLRLLDLDLAPPKVTSTRRRGRPKNSFPRARVHITMTEDERSTLDEMVELFSDRFNQNFTRGHIIAFLLFYMRGLLQDGRGKKMTIPEGISSFSDLADYLHQEE